MYSKYWHEIDMTIRFRSLGSSRFLKTVRCRHRNGPVAVKIYIKPDLGLSLSRYQRRLKGMS
jgi:phosphoinositide-3-kinase, regulatory subunit 4